MDIIKSAIHRLAIKVTCGCTISGEYEDPAYKRGIGTTVFTPCDSHRDQPGIEFKLESMKEMLDHVAKEEKEPPVRPARPTVPSEAGAEGTPPPAGTETRTPFNKPARAASGIRRVSPSAPQSASMRARAAGPTPAPPVAGGAAAKVASKLKGGPPPMATDMDGARPDIRVAKLVESSGMLDEDSDVDEFDDAIGDEILFEDED